ncbi:MAG: helix-turn-helix transcriptional regulator [Clostridia bacterium]|nr:helix-turn-helix transcriptional regulator [Clostridia bacterium]
MTRFSGITIDLGSFEAKLVFPTALKSERRTAETESGRPHIHFESEVHFVLSGNCTLFTEQREYALKENSICMIPKGIAHDSIVAEEKNRLFNMLISLKAKRGKKKTQNTKMMYSWESINDVLIFENCERICDYVRDLISAGEDEYLTKSLMTVIFIKMSGLVEEKYPGHSKVAKACELHYDGALFDAELENYLMTNYRRKLTRDDVAEHIGISSVQLSRIIKKNYSMSYCDLITTLRMNEAKRLMAGDKTITEIAKSLGYTTYNGFAAAFLKKYGVSPDTYRKEIKK